MLSLFPVQTKDHLKAKEITQWQLINQLLECCQLEQWLSPDKVTSTCSGEYFGKSPQQQMKENSHFNLSNQELYTQLQQLTLTYNKEFAAALCNHNTPMVVLRLSNDEQLLLLTNPRHCSKWQLKKACLPILFTPYDPCIKDTQGRDKTSNSASQSDTKFDRQSQVIDSAEQLLSLLLLAMDEKNTLSDDGIVKLKESLKASFLGQQWSALAYITPLVYKQEHWYQTLIASERWASLADRPFHPLAKGKLGFKQQDYQHYMAEFSEPIYLNWVAVDKKHLMFSTLLDQIELIKTPAQYLLNPHQQQNLQQELQARGIDDSHIAIPVHPWQMAYEIDEFFRDDLSNKTVVKLRFCQLVSHASSSMRSMLLCADTPYSIKLPLGIYALNSKRYLPALKLINAEKNQALLSCAQQRDAILDKQMWLWDERLWWGYMPPEHRHDKSSTNPCFYQEKPTHLGVLLRCLPEELCDDSVRLLPMASLGMMVYQQQSSYHIFDELLQGFGSLQGTTSQLSKESQYQSVTFTTTQASVISCFSNLCQIFLGTMLRCIRLGFIPELHGQNVIMVIKNNHFSGLLLRDHDSVRIHLPWLARHQIDDPQYLSPPNFRNRLYRDTPEELIFYLQSLGILVNIRAIIESLVEHYKLAELALWTIVREIIEQTLERLDFDNDQYLVLKKCLLDSPFYPHKTLMLPVIERGQQAHGSMPSGESVVTNPISIQALDIQSRSSS